MKKRAFTLAELMVVVAIVGVMAAVAFPSYTKYRCKADWSELQSTMADIALRMENYRANHGVYPTNDYWDLLGFDGTPYVGDHYEPYISSTNRTYTIAMKDTKKQINCTAGSGFDNDVWVKVNSSPKIYHVQNVVTKGTEELPDGYSVP